tara:strand:+ start:1266 stop:1718 length:453 start_codon:yes stop_codon:yes gene_type:complete
MAAGSWEISFFVSGTPRAQPRPRAMSLNGRFARMYNPNTANVWKKSVNLAARSFRPLSPIKGPVEVNMVFFFKRPESHFLKRKSGDVLRKDQPTWHTVKPDIDNLIKAILDELTKLEFWTDDCQVTSSLAKKMYVPTNENPGCFLSISEV